MNIDVVDRFTDEHCTTKIQGERFYGVKSMHVFKTNSLHALENRLLIISGIEIRGWSFIIQQ